MPCHGVIHSELVVISLPTLQVRLSQSHGHFSAAEEVSSNLASFENAAVYFTGLFLHIMGLVAIVKEDHHLWNFCRMLSQLLTISRIISIGWFPGCYYQKVEYDDCLWPPVGLFEQISCSRIQEFFERNTWKRERKQTTTWIKVQVEFAQKVEFRTLISFRSILTTKKGGIISSAEEFTTFVSDTICQRYYLQHFHISFSQFPKIPQINSSVFNVRGFCMLIKPKTAVNSHIVDICMPNEPFW